MVEGRTLRKAAASTEPSPSNGYTTSSEKILKIALEAGTDNPSSNERTKLRTRTDYSRWRLLDEKGRQTWHYLSDDEAAKKWPQSVADKYFLGLPTVKYPLFAPGFFLR